MTKIKIKLLIDPDETNSANDILSNCMNVCWKILEKDISFVCTVENFQKCTNDNPENNVINRKCISFEGVCDGDIDIKNNSIKGISIQQENSFYTKHRISNGIYYLDDYYEEELKPNIVCTILSVFFANPMLDLMCGCVSVYLNDSFYKKDFFINSSIQSYWLEQCTSLFKERISFKECWNWITKNTSIFQKGHLSSPSFSAISYILNRELHESLVYSTIGLESLFCPKESKSTKYLLSKRIPRVFSNIEESDIKKLYEARSNIVHGNIETGNFYFAREIIQTDESITKACVLGATLLVESIRTLIKRNATHYVFREKIEYNFE